MNIRQGNIFAALPSAVSAEVFENLIELGGVRIERITSQGQTTTEGEWYDQERHEWVLLLQGCADLQFDYERAPLRLLPGDHVLIPAHCRHRVVWTDPNLQTVWLAVHWDATTPCG